MKVTDLERAGRALRHARAEAGLSQAELAERLGIARSTIANLEAGRHGVSPAVRALLDEALPGWLPKLTARATQPVSVDNNGLSIEEVGITYVFEQSKSPSEIIQLRRVRAVRAGVRRYHLGLRRSDHKTFTADTQTLWGGGIVEHPSSVEGWATHSVDFGRGLRRGETHEFAMRSWVERDAEPDTEIWLEVTAPTRLARMNLTFNGPYPSRAWAFTKPSDEREKRPEETAPVPAKHGYPVTATFEQLVPNVIYALCWEW